MNLLFEPAPLEDWLRDYYFEAKADISSSGAEPYGLGEALDLLAVDPREFAGISLRDSRSAGADVLRDLVAERAGITDSGRVLVGNGSTEAQLLVMAATLAAGDEVVVVDPAYHTLVATVRAIGCRVTSWPLRPENRFRPDLAELRRLVTPRVKMIIVNFPHNPCGVTLTHAEQRELVEIADRNGCYLFWDGAFEDLAYDAPPLPAVSTMYERGLSFGTMSKSFGLPGLRVGWGIVPPEVVRRAVQVRDYTTLALSPVVEFIAERALRMPERLLAPRLGMARENRETVREWLAAHDGLVSADLPQAGVLLFPALTGMADTRPFCHRLMREHGVLVVPGECFGVPGHVRVGFGGRPADLRRGLDALSAALRAGEG
ncbi:capreomycidine synthase [Streptomyces sp.]|uniref:capreomycidine synthase n=1 Tax=Streptomyces sp. TaxID=1931 RepID=UPI002F3EEB6E